MITDEEAIRQRHSVRQYTDEPISEVDRATLREEIERFNAEGDLHMALVCDKVEAFAGRLAPAAMNQQKFRFGLVDGDADASKPRVKATTGLGSYTDIDLGIAKLHFELGAVPDAFEWA